MKELSSYRKMLSDNDKNTVKELKKQNKCKNKYDLTEENKQITTDIKYNYIMKSLDNYQADLNVLTSGRKYNTFIISKVIDKQQNPEIIINNTVITSGQKYNTFAKSKVIDKQQNTKINIDNNNIIVEKYTTNNDLLLQLRHDYWINKYNTYENGNNDKYNCYISKFVYNYAKYNDNIMENDSLERLNKGINQLVKHLKYKEQSKQHEPKIVSLFNKQKSKSFYFITENKYNYVAELLYKSMYNVLIKSSTITASLKPIIKDLIECNIDDFTLVDAKVTGNLKTNLKQLINAQYLTDKELIYNLKTSKRYYNYK